MAELLEDGILETIRMYLEFSFVRNALIAGVLISLCSSLLGVTLVLRRFSYIGDGLSHVAFGAMSVAAVISLTDKMVLILPVTIISAVLLLYRGQNRKVKGDAAIAMISVAALAIGYLLMNLFTSSSNVSGDVCTTLFGSTSILTLSELEVIASVVLSIVVILIFILIYNKLFAITFDEIFAGATGTKTKLYNTILAVVIAVIIVLAMNLVGSLLISALVIFPAMSAMRVCRSFKSVTIFSTIVSVTGTLFGMFISILAGTPVGATIVAFDMLIFGICMIIAIVTKRN